MTFTISRLVNSRAIVRGTDIVGGSGTCVVDTAQWDEINGNSQVDKAEAAFDEAVKEFFAPLTEAAAALHTSVQQPDDSMSYIVLDEGVESTAGRRRNLVRLSRDSIILRMVEQGSTDRLVWVDDQLEILEANGQATVPGTAPAGGVVTTENLGGL